MFNLESILRENIRNLTPYSSARDEFSRGGSVFLDANENSLGSATENNFNRYPDPHQALLKEHISEQKGIDAKRIFIGNGSDEIIDLLIRATSRPGLDQIIVLPPTYGMYSVSAAINDVSVIETPLDSDFKIDLAEVKKTFSETTKLIFLCSPNNPTANLLNIESVASLAESFNGLVIVDEAYIDFSPEGSSLPLLAKHPNLVVMQTFSKAWGLAGLRIGMGFASEEIVEVLDRIKPPYNISEVAQELALSALKNTERKNSLVSKIINERKRLAGELSKCAAVKKVFPSDANFLLIKTTSAKRIYNYLLKKGIVVRDRSSLYLCDECLRITVGTPEENDKLLEAFLQIEGIEK